MKVPNTYLEKNFVFSVSLEPDEESSDPQQFEGFMNFLDNDLTNEERSVFFTKTLPNLATRALKIKDCRPKSGLHFSLQQQGITKIY